MLPVFLLLLPAPAPGQMDDPSSAVTETAYPDTLTADRETYWGPWPARTDSVTGNFSEAGRPAWETTVMVPYWLIGLPLRGLYHGGGQAVAVVDDLGLFAGAGEFSGLPGPGGSYIMPALSYDGQEGLTFGVDVTRPHFIRPGNLLFLKADRSARRSGSYGGGALFHLPGDWELELGGGFESRSKARFHGLGLGSFSGDLSYYYRSVTWGGLELGRQITPIVRLGARAYFSGVQVLPARYDVDVSLPRVHADDLPPGFPGQSNGWTVRLGFDRDNAEQTGRPRRGGFQSLGVSLFQATDSRDLSTLTWHANLERFFKLWHTDRTLAVRGFANRITNIGRDEVPLARLITFQRPDELRGFNSLRFYGHGSVGVSVEYRWPIWVVRGRDDLGLDAYLFSDSGQVFDYTDEISLANFNWTGGGGLRLIGSDRKMAARFEVGVSHEATIFRLTFSQTFQYNRRGFLYGKNPTRVY